MYFDTIQDLKEAFLVSSPPNGEYIVGGYFDVGDGGGGTFVWVLTNSPLQDDKGIVIEPIAIDPNTGLPNPVYGKGYFKRLFSGAINVRWFGAILEQTDPHPPIDPHTGLPYVQPIADVTAYVHAARDSKAFADNGTLYFPKGEYPGGI